MTKTKAKLKYRADGNPILTPGMTALERKEWRRAWMRYLVTLPRPTLEGVRFALAVEDGWDDVLLAIDTHLAGGQ